MGKPKRKQEVGDKINLFRMIRDVLIHSMSKGQLPVTGIIIVILVALVKMPSEDVSKLVFQIVDLLVAGRLLGWGLALVFLGGWFIHAKKQRQIIHSEMARLSGERDTWQRKAIPGKVISSED